MNMLVLGLQANWNSCRFGDDLVVISVPLDLNPLVFIVLKIQRGGR